MQVKNIQDSNKGFTEAHLSYCVFFSDDIWSLSLFKSILIVIFLKVYDHAIEFECSVGL